MTTDLPGLPKLYTERELADYLEIELHTVRRLRRCGKLRYTRAGVSPRFTEEHVKEYLALGESSCQNSNKTGGTESGNSSSRNPTANTRHGVSAGQRRSESIDRHEALLLTRQIMAERKQRSPNTR